MYYLGIDAGASTLKLVAVSAAGDILASEVCRHAGNVAAAVKDLFARLPVGMGACGGAATCGSAAQLFCKADSRVAFVDDIPALVSGVQAMAPDAVSIIQIGAYSSEAVVLSPDGAPRYARSKDCAAGSGIFLESQMERLGLPLQEYSQMVARATKVPRLSGRCAVFAKTDVIHCQQEGESIENILLGLCYALARSFKASVAYEVGLVAPVAFAGGVAANSGVVRAMRDVLKLSEGDLLVDQRFEFASALGAALSARDASAAGEVGVPAVADACPSGFDVAALPALLRVAAASEDSALPRLAPLPGAGDMGAGGVGEFLDALHPNASPENPVPVYLGIDVGSTSTDAVLLDADGKVVDAQYARTGGDPRQAVRHLLDSIERRLGDRVRIVARATTGSGRVIAGELIGADLVCNEITAQARAAAAADPLATNVFEIGGQDSKFISLENGRVADFQMNKICAAGTGSFIEEQAVYLGISLAEFGDEALLAKAPVDLGERCTVFVETAVRTALSEGARVEDVAAGLCLSVVRNYLHRVVGTRPVGSRVVLQGGVAYNKGIVAAFRQLAHAEVTVSPWFAVSGAAGAALLVKDSLAGGGREAAMRGTRAGGALINGAAANATASREANAQATCGVPAATVATVSCDGSAAANLGRRDPLESPRTFYAKTEELYLKGYDPKDNADPAKKTVGIPRCLMLHKLFPMANVFFRELGYNVLLSDATDEEAVLLSQSTAASDVCLPVKLLHGHMEQLVQRGVDYIFVPSVQTIRHVNSSVPHNYACVYLQSGPQIAARALGLEQRGVQLLSPVFKMDFGQPAMAEAMLSVGRLLEKPARETALAMLSGSQAVAEFTRSTEELGDKLLAGMGQNDRAFVIITRNYGIADPVLNMGVPDLLLDRGQHVLTLSHLHAHDIDLSADYPDLYWPFAQHIVSGARIVARDPRLFAVYLTSHGCGPDSMISHLFKREMGDKPYLQLEVDEHASAVGVTTRIEAFLDAVAQYSATRAADDAVTSVVASPVESSGGHGEDAPDNPVLQSAFAADVAGNLLKMPSIGAYGPVVAAWLEGRGLAVSEVPLDGNTLALGRAGLMEGEYYTFAALLGAATAAVRPDGNGEEYPDRGYVSGGSADLASAASGVAKVGALAPEVAQSAPAKAAFEGDLLLLPSSEGGDADGQFARVIATVLQRFGHEGFKILAPKFEQYPFALSDPRGLFRCLVAADICQAVPSGFRVEFLHAAANAAACGFSDESLLELAARARDVAFSAGDARGEARCVNLVGEWPLVHSDELVAGAWNRIEARGVRVSRMPLSEALCFLWVDAREAMAKPAPGVVVTQEEIAFMDAFLAWSQSLLREVDVRLGGISPFASDLRALRNVAEADIHCLIGGFGRYRYAKTKAIIDAGGAVIAPSSLYENTGIVVRQLLGAHGRMLDLSFDGALDSAVDERISAFLHYL